MATRKGCLKVRHPKTQTPESLPFATYKALWILASNPFFPTLLAFLQKTTDVWLWRAWCPYCRRYHTHGGGEVEGNPFKYLGHRVAHCVSETPLRKTGYLLVFGGYWDELTPKQKRYGPTQVEEDKS
jgi:hypothetical protein